jgi:putative hydrolase of the HAD superfamily
MVKNIIFDIGGILFDDDNEVINNIFNEDCTLLCRKAYSGLRECTLGDMEVSDYVASFNDDVDYEKIKYLFADENLHISYPLINENYEYIKSLKERGYNLYLLSNITKNTFNYVSSVIDINGIFSGGIYSYQEHLVKPDKAIFELIISRYGLNKEETIFFDDRMKNVQSAMECGIRSFVFNSIEDVENGLKERER